MTTRLLRVIDRLPVPVRDFVYFTIARFARFIVLVMVIPILIVAFIVSTLVVALLTIVFGPLGGPIGTIVLFGWLAAWTVLPVVITVRMWRSIPALQGLVVVAGEGLGIDSEVETASREKSDPATFETRIASADARLSPADTDAPPDTKG